MVDYLVDEPVLVVFIVVGVGAAVGRVHVRGISIGPAAALFVGLGVGAIDERLSNLAALGVIREIGLVLFTYTLGLASGPSFFAALRRGGAVAVALTGALVSLLAGITALAAHLFGLSPADRAGVFAGASTNTPALQAAAEALDHGDPVIGYSLAYPAAVVAMLVVLTLLLGRRLPLPKSLEPPQRPPPEPLVNWTVRIDQDGLPSLEQLRTRYPGLGFSRIQHGGLVAVARAADTPSTLR